MPGHDDECSALNAVQRGVQDYLVKGQIDAQSLSRSLRYTLARHQLGADLERELERSECMVGRVFGDQPGRDDSSVSGILSDDRAGHLKSLNHAYQEVVIEYLRSVRTGVERPTQLVKRMARKMAAIQIRAKHVAQLHISVLGELEKKTPGAQRRALTNDARLLLLQLLGRLMDLYLKQAQEQGATESVLG